MLLEPTIKLGETCFVVGELGAVLPVLAETEANIKAQFADINTQAGSVVECCAHGWKGAVVDMAFWFGRERGGGINRPKFELVCGLPFGENGHWIWFGFTAGHGRDTSANLT